MVAIRSYNLRMDVTQLMAADKVVSKGYERKDLEIAPNFYLPNGVKDVIVYNPRTQEVRHFRHASTKIYTSPVKIALECGCSCEV